MMGALPAPMQGDAKPWQGQGREWIHVCNHVGQTVAFIVLKLDSDSIVPVEATDAVLHRDDGIDKSTRAAHFHEPRLGATALLRRNHRGWDLPRAKYAWARLEPESPFQLLSTAS